LELKPSYVGKLGHGICEAGSAEGGGGWCESGGIATDTKCEGGGFAAGGKCEIGGAES